MKQFAVVFLLVCLCGCEGLRSAATEAQKENAWLHERVCAAAAETAASEKVSPTLCGLTELAHDQSRAFVVDYGLPQDRPVMKDVDAVLTQGAVISEMAQVDSARRPDVWSLADNAMELGIALAGLVGGVYGIRIVGYLKAAREKSKAIKEIVAGNELFKQLWPEHADRFKEAQRRQSPATKQIVTAVRAE
jgi:hypothetical protein